MRVYFTIDIDQKRSLAGASRLKSWGWAFRIAGAVTLVASMIALCGRQGVLGWPFLGGDMTNHLGAEYDNIAQAMVRGDGFADPFGRGDGPTGWMPPLLPSVLYVFYWVGDGQREWVVGLVRLLQPASLFLCLTIVLQPFANTTRRWWVATIALLAVLSNLHYLLQLSHDHVLLMPMVTCIWWNLSRTWTVKVQPITEVTRGIAGGMVALASPVIAFSWAILTVFRIGIRPVLMCSALASIFVVCPWIVRNRIELGNWTPVKSNSAYELYQAQAVDDDGVFDLSTCRTHPYAKNSQDAELYTELGERAFLIHKADIFWRDVRSRPGRWVRRTIHRGLAATVYPAPFDESHRIRILARLGGWCFALASCGSVVFILRSKWSELPDSVRIAISLWGLILLPYVLVSFYQRYAIPLFPLQIFLIGYAVTDEPNGRTDNNTPSERKDLAF